MATLQVRSIDDELYKALEARAASDNRSTSQEVIAIIKDYLSKPNNHKHITNEFLEICGTWKSDLSEKEIASDAMQGRTKGNDHRMQDLF